MNNETKTLPESKKNNSYPMGSLIFFVVVFVLTILFFVLVMWVNKGPIDKVVWEPVAPFTLEEKRQRNQVWRTSTPDMVKEGKQLFDIQVFGDIKPVFDLIKQGKYGRTEVELYRILTYGVPGTAFRNWDYLPQVVRWKIVHYLRSQMQQPQTASPADWDALDREGI